MIRFKTPRFRPTGEEWIFTPSQRSYCRAFEHPEDTRDLTGRWGIERFGWGETYVAPFSVTAEEWRHLKAAYLKASAK